MVRGGKRETSGRPADPMKGFVPPKFVNYELSDEQRRECKSLELSLDNLDNELVKLEESNYKISLRWDDYSSSYAAWLIAPDKDEYNAGYILSGRGSTPLKALKQALYKHHNVFAGQWPIQPKYNPKEEIDD